VKLRNAHLAAIDSSKVVDCLLNDAHPDNGGKARFFASIGYSQADPERLMKALRDVAEHGEVVSSAESVHGEKYVVDGWLPVHTQETRMIKEHDRIVLTEPVPAEGLEVGDVGTVVHVYADGKAFEVEFTTLDGKTAAVATVEAAAARPVTGHEITHSRELTRAS
jgi:hypothetical protein